MALAAADEMMAVFNPSLTPFKTIPGTEPGIPSNAPIAAPATRMVGLLILKHVRNVSDESVVEQWQENIYYQYFCGEQSIQTSAPCTPTELVEFRKRIGEEGVELILKESIRVNDDHDDIDKAFIE